MINALTAKIRFMEIMQSAVFVAFLFKNFGTTSWTSSQSAIPVQEHVNT